jgi:hypothetical protein
VCVKYDRTRVKQGLVCFHLIAAPYLDSSVKDSSRKAASTSSLEGVGGTDSSYLST